MAKLDIKDKVDGKELDLSLNELKDAPVEDLASLPKVTHVDLSCNHIKKLPASFCSLTHLIRLDLSKNQLLELPQNFGNLRQLQYLDLYGNHLELLPVSFCHLKSLRWLDLKNNPLSQRLKSVTGDCLDEKQCQQCAKKVVEYFRDLNSELERQKQKQLQKEREREAAEKAEVERELEREKERKKAEKLRRKTERNEERLKATQQKLYTEINNVQGNDVKKNGFVPSGKKHGNLGSFFKWIFLLVILIPLLVIGGDIAYHVYCGHPITSIADLQQLAAERWIAVEKMALSTWEILVVEAKRLFQLLVSKWKRWHAEGNLESGKQDL